MTIGLEWIALGMGGVGLLLCWAALATPQGSKAHRFVTRPLEGKRKDP